MESGEQRKNPAIKRKRARKHKAVGSKHQPTAKIPEQQLTSIDHTHYATETIREPFSTMSDNMQRPSDMPTSSSAHLDHSYGNGSNVHCTYFSPRVAPDSKSRFSAPKATSDHASVDTFRDMLSRYDYDSGADQQSPYFAQSQPHTPKSSARKRRAPQNDIGASQVRSSTSQVSVRRSGPSRTSPNMTYTCGDAELRISDLSDSISDIEPLILPIEVPSQSDSHPLARKLALPTTKANQVTRAPKLPASRLSPATTKPGETAVSQTTLENPRSVMALDELELLLVQRDLPRREQSEDHAQLVARLHEIDNSLSAKELNALLKEAYLPTSFPKTEKIRHLQRHDAENSRRGLQGIKSTDAAFKQTYEGYETHGVTY